MYDLSARTGPYLHAPDDLIRLRYETGGTPRLFTVLIASATERDRVDPEGAGIVVLDEDEWRVLLDRHSAAPGRDLGDELYRVAAMSWAEFSGFCRSHPRFRGGSEDVTSPHDQPLPGSRRRQDRSPDLLKSARAPGLDDLRSALMTLADGDPACSVRFPEGGRKEALQELSARIARVNDPLPYRLAWSVPVPAAPDLTGLGGDRPVDRSLDPLWEETVSRRPELVEEALVEALEAVAGGRLSTFGAQDEGRYDLRLLGSDAGPTLTLFGLDGQELGAGTRDAVMERLASLPVRDLRDLWKLGRTFDVETGPERVATRFRAGLNRVRSETEASRELEPAPSGP